MYTKQTVHSSRTMTTKARMIGACKRRTLRVVGESEAFRNMPLFCSNVSILHYGGKHVDRRVYAITTGQEVTGHTNNRTPLAHGTVGVPRQFDPHLQGRVVKSAAMAGAGATTRSRDHSTPITFSNACRCSNPSQPSTPNPSGVCCGHAKSLAISGRYLREGSRDCSARSAAAAKEAQTL